VQIRHDENSRYFIRSEQRGIVFIGKVQTFGQVNGNILMDEYNNYFFTLRKQVLSNSKVKN
jgi:hypothetical protein